MNSFGSVISSPERKWPGRTVRAAPRWLATDLSGADPGPSARRQTIFRLLIEMGVTEIELGSPGTDPEDHAFLRAIIEGGSIPADVTITVSVPADVDLLRRVVGSLDGAGRAVIHLIGEAGRCAAVLRGHRRRFDGVLGLQWSPGTGGGRPDGPGAVVDAWGPESERPMTLSLGTLGERVLPHVLADRVEWYRAGWEHVCLSVRPGDEWGTGVAAAELALLAGAGRVEGRLFGGGGGVDLAAIAGNLVVDGVEPGLRLPGLERARLAVAGGTVSSRVVPGAGRRAVLSDAERRVAVLAAGGCSNREISVRLFITVSTVEQHLTRAFRKLHVTRRTDLAANLSGLG